MGKNIDKELEQEIARQPKMEITKETLQKAGDFSLRNRETLEKSHLCGCYACNRIFRASELTPDDFCDDGTACCPYCGIDAVIGDASGYAITPEFIRRMNKKWF